MTTVAPDLSAMIEDRWRTLLNRYDLEGREDGLSDAYMATIDGIRRLAIAMIHGTRIEPVDLRRAEEFYPNREKVSQAYAMNREGDQLEELVNDLERTITASVQAFAAKVELQRAQRRAAA